MIFRAFVDTPRSGWHNSASQCVVFVEASNKQQAAENLRLLLACLWQVEAGSIDWENLQSEDDLISNPLAAEVDADHRLFVSGWHKKPLFENGERTVGSPVFLLSTQLDRVMKAYLTLPREHG